MKLVLIGLLTLSSLSVFANPTLTTTYSVTLTGLEESIVKFEAKDGNVHLINCISIDRIVGGSIGYKRFHDGLYDLSFIGESIKDCKAVVNEIKKSSPTIGDEYEIKVQNNNVIEVNLKL